MDEKVTRAFDYILHAPSQSQLYRVSRNPINSSFGEASRLENCGATSSSFAPARSNLVIDFASQFYNPLNLIREGGKRRASHGRNSQSGLELTSLQTRTISSFSSELRYGGVDKAGVAGQIAVDRREENKVAPERQPAAGQCNRL